ncbi:hypothetical protein CRUP_034675, partial [Coryphaenoides rupestris]
MDGLSGEGWLVRTQSFGKLDYTSGGHSLGILGLPSLFQNGCPWLPCNPVDYYTTFTKNCSGAFTQEEIRNIRARLLRVLLALRSTGLLDNTVVMFTADHGDLAMEHRQYYKMSMFEGSAHVPLLLAGLPAPGGLSGHSLLALLLPPLSGSGTTRPPAIHPGWALSEYHGCNANASTYMLKEGGWKYIAYADGQNLTLDNTELHNVVTEFPLIAAYMEERLQSIVAYPEVSRAVQLYNKQQFVAWQKSSGAITAMSSLTSGGTWIGRGMCRPMRRQFMIGSVAHDGLWTANQDTIVMDTI